MKKIFNENHELFQEYNFKSHDFRHTIATMFYEDGVPLQSVRDYLGHDYEEMTQQYVDYMPKRISKQIRNFSQKKEAVLLRNKEGASVENRFYIKELDSYQKASDLSKERMGTTPIMIWNFCRQSRCRKKCGSSCNTEGKNLVAEKFYTERRFYHHLCRMLKEKTTGWRVFWTGIKKNGCSR